MKCPSIACLWPSSSSTSTPEGPPSHLITCSIALNSPPSLYTGASDGSIVFWSLLPHPSESSPQPLSILCGHSSPIAALAHSPDSLLISACTDAVLCVWSAAASRRCRLRRRLPPWAGSPSLIQPLPSSPHHLCILTTAPSLLLLDSLSLQLLHSHTLSPTLAVTSMTLLQNKDAILVDVRGAVLTLSLEKGSPPLDDTSNQEDDSSLQKIRASAVSHDGRLLALVFDTRCVFKLVAGGVELGDVSCVSLMHPPVGVTFLEGELEDRAEIFVLWSSDGAALLYSVSSLDSEFKFGPLCEIPAVPFLLDERSSVSFCKFKSFIVRSVSVRFSLGEKDCSLWKPHVSIWSIPPRVSGDTSIYSPTLLGEGGIPGCPIEAKQISDRSFEKKSLEIAQNSKSSNSCVLMDKRTVSTSLVLSEGSYTPYAVVYGFFSGDIRVVQFANLSLAVSSPSESQKHDAELGTSEQFFTGHSGAVLCLAARCIPMNSIDQRVSRVLVSGSTDCTIHIWDLDLGHPLSVLHHHVGPVKQILLPSLWTDHPWNNCFLSVGEDCCVALVSLETLRVERMFPGHPVYPSMVAWDSTRGYVACLTGNTSSQSSSSPSSSSSSSSSSSNLGSLLYLWDVKSGARERIIRGTASRSMFDHFCRGINMNSVAGDILGVSTSASLLLLPFIDDPNSTQLHVKKNEKGNITMPTTGVSHMRSREPPEAVKGKVSPQNLNHSSESAESNSTTDLSSHQICRNMSHPVKSTCRFAGIASVEVDLSSLMTIHFAQSSYKQVIGPSIEHDIKGPDFQQGASTDKFDIEEIETLESCLLRLCLSFLHLWDVDKELDKLLMEEMNVCKPDGFHIASGVIGDRGSLTLMFPGLHANLQLWKSSSEFCAMRSLAIVSIAQRLISLSHANTAASSALAAFYTRNFAERVPDIKPPSLQLLVSFWQDPSEHVRMAARSLFHCAAPRAVPHALSNHKNIQLESPLNVLQGHNDSDNDATSLNIDEAPERPAEMVNCSELDKSSVMTWLDSFVDHEWISWIGGTNQDGMASHIVVAAALVVWYPSLVKEGLANLVVNQLIKLVMSMNDRYSSTAAELLAEGMDSTWKACLGPEIPHLVGDIFFQIELLTGSPLNNATEKLALAVSMREALVEILLPSLAMADIAGFLNVVEGQIWATSSDSPVHLVSLKTLIRVVRGSPKPLAPYLDKVVNYVLQTMDPGNLVMRKSCLKSSLTALREITRVFPMVAMNESSTRLAIGDAIGDIRNVTIRVYDIESVTKIKILDASAPLGLPSFLEGASNPKLATAISALSFSPDGEGLVAFSENGLMIRWWSLGTGWWEKLSRNLVPVQCTKLIFVPPWEGFSPNSSRSSIMASMLGHTKKTNSQGSPREVDDADRLRVLLHNLDLSYRLQWVGGRNVLLTRHGQELGTFPL